MPEHVESNVETRDHDESHRTPTAEAGIQQERDISVGNDRLEDESLNFEQKTWKWQSHSSQKESQPDELLCARFQTRSVSCLRTSLASLTAAVKETKLVVFLAFDLWMKSLESAVGFRLVF